MAITNFIPEIWSAQLLEPFYKSLVYGDVVNRDYEGDIANAGDTVRITSVGRPTVSSYTANSTTITPEELTDAQRTLVVDQAKYFAFKIDDIDKRQALGGIMDAAINEAAYAVRDVVDQYIAGLYTGVVAANALGAVALTSAATAYVTLVNLKTKLDEANVPTDGRWAVVPPWVHSLLLQDNRFIDASASGSTEPLLNGRVGRAAGFEIRLSNNAPAGTGNNSMVIAGHSSAITFAAQINSVEAYRPESSFSDAVKGLMVYGAKLVRPYAIATCDASPD